MIWIDRKQPNGKAASAWGRLFLWAGIKNFYFGSCFFRVLGGVERGTYLCSGLKLNGRWKQVGISSLSGIRPGHVCPSLLLPSFFLPLAAPKVRFQSPSPRMPGPERRSLHLSPLSLPTRTSFRSQPPSAPDAPSSSPACRCTSKQMTGGLSAEWTSSSSTTTGSGPWTPIPAATPTAHRPTPSAWPPARRSWLPSPTAPCRIPSSPAFTAMRTCGEPSRSSVPTTPPIP